MSELRVLVVEDYADAAEAQAELLKVLGYQVWIARDGFDAVDIASDFLPDVVLLDLQLPGKNGYEVARELRARVTRRMVIIAVSGLGSDVDRTLAVGAGLDYYLTKPVDVKILKTLLAMVSTRVRRAPQRAHSTRVMTAKAS
jgi:two-component system OmpR family response regulator